MVPQQYCLRWKHHHTNVQSMFAKLLEKERFCDVTLYCSPSFATQVSDKDGMDSDNIRGVSLRAHRVVLAACSELLGTLLGAHEAQGEPVLVIDGAEPKHVKALLDYMYTGEMNVHHSQLAGLLKTAEELRIKGLTDIRWNNKDEPPDCQTGAVSTTTSAMKRHLEQKLEGKIAVEHGELHVSKRDLSDEVRHEEKVNVNGGPPPLIKIPTKDKSSPLKRDFSDTDSRSPKRVRMTSCTENTDDEERDQEWRHGNLDISAERVVAWGASEEGNWSRELSDEGSDDEWADAPADIGSFLHTRLKVDGDNSADEDTNDGAPPSTSSSVGTSGVDIKVEPKSNSTKLTVGPKSGPTDPRFKDVVKLNDYLRHGRRPQFWEENYVKRVMDAVRIKELEMKQAAEILGVSYGTLYGRYRDVYGCINRPYRNHMGLILGSTAPTERSAELTPAALLHGLMGDCSTARDFWQSKGPAEVLDSLQRGEMTLETGALALGVSPGNLAAYLADITHPSDKDFEPIPIEVDPSLKTSSKPQTYVGASSGKIKKNSTIVDKASKKLPAGSVTDDDPSPVALSVANDAKRNASSIPTASIANAGKWPSIRVASLDSLRGGETAAPAAPPTSPSHLMRTRPDLTIVAAKKTEAAEDETIT